MKKLLLSIVIIIVFQIFPVFGPSKAFAQKQRIKISTPVEDIKMMKVIPDSSSINWKGNQGTGEYSGKINISSGSFRLFKSDDLMGGAFEIDMASITNTGMQDAEANSKIVEKLRSENIFWVEKFPKATFKVKSWLPLTNQVNNERKYRIDGELTIKGITQLVTFQAYIKMIENRGVFTGSAPIDRTKFDSKVTSKSSQPALTENNFPNYMVLNFRIVFEE